MQILGTSVGLDRDGIKAWILNETQKHKDFFDAILCDSMPRQSALLLLRESGVMRFNHLARTLPPALTYDSIASFDDNILDVFQAKFDLVDPNDEAKQQIQLPCRHSGLGLAAQSNVVHHAYWSAGIGTLEDMKFLFQDEDSFGDSDHLPFVNDMITSLNWLQAAGIPIAPAENALLPESIDGALQFYSTHEHTRNLQSALANHSATARFTSFKDALPQPSLARVLSASGPGAAAWLKVFPSEEYIMPDTFFTLAVRLRLGIPLHNALPRFCTCREDMHARPAHLLSCRYTRHAATSYTHDVIKFAIARICRLLHINAASEPKYCKGSRPDIDIFFDITDHILLDVSMINPSAKSYTHISHTALGAAAARERFKINYHKALAREEKAKIVPFVLESFGAFGESARKFISRLAAEAADNTKLYTRSEVHSMLVNTCSFLLQLGNARVIRNRVTYLCRA